jgi:hypothetical protein
LRRDRTVRRNHAAFLLIVKTRVNQCRGTTSQKTEARQTFVSLLLRTSAPGVLCTPHDRTEPKQARAEQNHRPWFWEHRDFRENVVVVVLVFALVVAVLIVFRRPRGARWAARLGIGSSAAAAAAARLLSIGVIG